ncbi:MAG: hypothetical protein M3069_16630 [Chloroflexota bacterium]|nr:hypothetical protein [Chloroflexota bacterium]
MSEFEPEHDPNQADEEYLADAYGALDDDQRRQGTESATATSALDTSTDTADTETEEQALQPTTTTTAPTEPGQQPVETAATDTTAEPSAGPSRRVFLIDGKEYPDPDSELPITGTRSVQAMYRDYFPGQLDNVDVAQKTRDDGTVEVTFKRRIGTKGARMPTRRRRPVGGSGEVVITLPSVVRVLAALPHDRPLAWDLVEQAIGPKGAVRLDYVPPAAQLNLAEAQLSARARLIELAVGELRRLRPSA